MASLRVEVGCEEDGVGKHKWSDHLIEAVSIRSYQKGRIRFHLAFEGDEVLADTIRRELHKFEGVKLEAYSVRTRNALVMFNPAITSDITVVTALLRGVREFARLHGECDLEHHHHDHTKHVPREHAHDEHDEHDHEPGHDHGDEDCDHDHSATSTDAGIRKELLKLVATGGVLGYVVYRKLRGRPMAFSGNPLLDVAALVTIISGYSIFRAGVDSVQKQGKATDDTLISIAVLATILMGESLTGLSVVWLINLGRLLEAITLKRSRTAIKELMDIAPNEAWFIPRPGATDAQVTRVPVDELEKGQFIRVFHGEKVPLDGEVIHGRALVKEAFITGESIPREKSVGERVYAGSLLESGDIDIEVTNLVHDTVVARMIDAIENVRDKKAPIEKIGTRFASQFIPISLGLAGVTLLVTGDLRRAITMLVIACPCAAGLATPTAVSAAIGQAARRGILIKGGTHLEMAAHIDTMILDKTGTLTVGEPSINRFVPVGNGSVLEESECLRLAGSAEQHTTHPLGLVLVKEARARKLRLVPVVKYKTHPGLGVEATVESCSVLIGNKRFLSTQQITVDDGLEQDALSGIVGGGESLLYFAVDGVLRGVFVVKDAVRPEAHSMLERLRHLGVKRVILASGDQAAVATHIARQLGITEVHSELLPEEKLKLVASLRAEGRRVAMVGDGINDAQALAEADLSIAMGAGRCDVAIETADVTLARNDLMLVAETLDVSRKTLKTIYQNFTAAVGINAGGLLFSAVGRLTPFSAALVHNASTIVVVMNSLRLGRDVAGTNPLNTIKEVKI